MSYGRKYPKKAEVTHLFKANKYSSEREGDFKKVEMMMVYCDPERVQLPPKHNWSCDSDKVTCHRCLLVWLELIIKDASVVNKRLQDSDMVKGPFPFRYSARRKYYHGEYEPDPEILERIRIGI